MRWLTGRSIGQTVKLHIHYSPGESSGCLATRSFCVNLFWLILALLLIFGYRKQVGVAALGGYLYAIGGCDHSTRFNSVERYDPVKDEWIEVCGMSVPRSGCGVGVLDGFIYAVGGYDGTSYLSSVER